jgi:hypothetical protein
MNDVEHLLATLKEMERMQWHQIERHSGLRYKEIQHEPAVDQLFDSNGAPADVTKRSLRVTRRKRLLGYRKDALFYLVHLDPDHELT